MPFISEQSNGPTNRHETRFSFVCLYGFNRFIRLPNNLSHQRHKEDFVRMLWWFNSRSKWVSSRIKTPMLRRGTSQGERQAGNYTLSICSRGHCSTRTCTTPALLRESALSSAASGYSWLAGC